MTLDEALAKDLAGLMGKDELGIKDKVFGPIYEKAAKKYGLDPSLLRSIALAESGENPAAVSPKGAKGMMQLMDETAKALGVKNPFAPEEAIFGAAKLMRENLDRYDGDLVDALHAYHGGTDKRNWGPLTKAYPDKVLSFWAPEEGAATGNYSLDDSILADLDELKTLPTLEAENIPQSTRREVSSDLWGMGKNFIQTSLLGAGIPVIAAGAAAKQVVDSIQQGIPWDDAVARVFPQRYGEVKSALEEARGKWEKEAPGAALGTELAGTIPAVMALIGSGGRAAQLGTQRLAQTMPQTAEALSKAGRFLGGTAGEGAGLKNFLLRQLSRGVSGAGQGAIGGLATSEALGEDPEQAAMMGALFGAPANVVGLPLLNAATAPLRAKIAPEVGQMAQEAEKLGLRLRGGQLSENKLVRGLDEGLVGGDPEQLEQFTRAVSRTFGADSPKITKSVLNDAADKIGAQLDAVAAKTNITVDKALLDGLDDVRKKALTEIPTESPELKKVLKQLDIIETEALMGNISGETYQALTRRNSPLGRLMQDRDGTVKYYGVQLRKVLDDALERNAAPDDMEALRTARKQWKNMLTVEDLVEKAQPSGVLNPQALQNAVRKSFDDYGYTGAGDLGTLGEAGRFLPMPGPSGAPTERATASFRNALTGSVLGELGNAALQFAPPGAATGLAMGAYGGAKAIGKLMETQAYRNMLIRNGIVPPPLAQNPLIPAGTQLYLEE